MLETTMIRRGSSQARDEERAVSELAEQLGAEDDASKIVFCSSLYDLDRLGVLRCTPRAMVRCTEVGTEAQRA